MLTYIIFLLILSHSFTSSLIKKYHILQYNSKETFIHKVDISKFYEIELTDIDFRVKK